MWQMSWYHCENSFLLTDSLQGPQGPQRSVDHTWRTSAVAQDSSLRCLSFRSLWVTCPGEYALGSSRRSGNTLVLQSSLVGATLLSMMAPNAISGVPFLREQGTLHPPQPPPWERCGKIRKARGRPRLTSPLHCNDINLCWPSGNREILLKHPQLGCF